MSPLFRIIAEISAEARRRGWTDAELARRAGITPEALSRMRTTGGARFDSIDRLAAVVDLRLKLGPSDEYVDALLGGNLLGEIEP